MENLDGRVIATAMPQMPRSFGASPVDLNIGMTAYLLALAVFIPISGWLADRFRAQPVFGGAIGLFTASSVLCGLSNGLWEFTAARILQGLGGAMMVPAGRLVVLRTTAKQDLLPWCRHENVGVIVYSPLASGLLTGAMTDAIVGARNSKQVDGIIGAMDFRPPELSCKNLLRERGTTGAPTPRA